MTEALIYSLARETIFSRADLRQFVAWWTLWTQQPLSDDGLRRMVREATHLAGGLDTYMRLCKDHLASLPTERH